MSHPLTKSQLCWVIIKAFGALLVLRSFLLIPGFVLGGGFSSGLRDFMIPHLLNGIVQFIIGFYLLNGGHFIHRVLMSEPLPENPIPIPEPEKRSPDFRPTPAPVKPKEPEDPKTTLTASESAAFTQWISENSHLQTRPIADQIALFRDFQRNSGHT